MKFLIKKLEWKHKNNKFLYYTKVIIRELFPPIFFRRRRTEKLRSIQNFDYNLIRSRVNYYNKLSKDSSALVDAIHLSELKIPKRQKVYYFDCYEYTRYFDSQLKANFLFGDITRIPEEPSILKSRPIHGNNNNSVILKLDKVRHFTYTTDSKEFKKKKNMLIGRGVVKQPHRIRFYEMYFNHPLCNLGQINLNKNTHWIKEQITIDEHLDYKFILCLEGNDVASNLKWVMSSNSLAVMPKPKYETWFMEGKLIPNFHYVEIKEDFSDLEEVLTYYIKHTEEAIQIIKNANTYTKQFRNKKQEDLISLLVLEKYFYRTWQLKPSDSSLYD